MRYSYSFDTTLALFAKCAATAIFCFCPATAAIADENEMVTYSSRITKVESFEHEGSPNASNAASAMFGLFGYFAHQASLQSTWYKFANPGGEEVGIESSGTFAVGQCVLVHVRKANVGNTKLFPGVASIEPHDGCGP